ncbi:MAG: TIGR00725 family protein [Aigarchaeota archaeon]|nr:TIGR00725 family protein [Aigarchaeota archaeon]MDW8092533.1 TIGR00725 family protein [Nitrososphaerota archaeon]
MGRRVQILVVGYNQEICTPEALRIAYEVGRAVARRGCILVTGGLGGVMEAASRGALEEGGMTVSIIPQKMLNVANPYSTVVVATGLGHMRNFVNVYSADGVIVVGGGAGTLSEVSEAYIEGKPIVCIEGSGGIADNLPEFLDERRTVRIMRARAPDEAVSLILDMLK